MGGICSSTNMSNNPFNHNKYVKYDESILKEKLPSSSHLLLLLQQQYLRATFIKFIEEKWIPPIYKDDPLNKNYSREAKTIALNFIEFWLDCKDFSLICKSNFKNYRACHIFEKYLMHGASKLLPVSANVIDECSESIFNGAGTEVSHTVFNNAEIEAVDFLVSEVYPLFESASLSVVARMHGNEVFSAVKDSIHRTRRGSISSPDYENLRKILTKIFADQEYLHAFKLYLGKEKSEIILYAYNETVEIRERLIHLLDASSDTELNLLIFLFYVNSFYDTYLSLGSQFRLNLPSAVRGDFMKKLASVEIADVDVLKILEEETFLYLLREHLTSFLSSPLYRQAIRSNRNSVCVMVSSLQDPILESSKDGEVLSSLKNSTINDYNSESSDKVDDTQRKELKVFIRSGYEEVFAEFLESKGKLSYLQFCQSVLRYQESLYTNDMDRAIDSSDIFDRYISRNAENIITLPDPLKVAVVKNIFRGSKFLFSDALDWVLDLLYNNYWLPFKSEIKQVNKREEEIEKANKKKEESSDSDDSSVESTKDSITDEKKDDVAIIKEFQTRRMSIGTANKVVPVDGIFTKYFSGNRDRRISTLDRRKSIRPIGRRNSIGAPKIADSDAEHIISKHKYGLSFRKIESSTLKSSQYIKDTLEHSQCCSIFKEFLERESGSQTLLFLLEVEEYRRIPQASFQLTRARKIYNKFIHPLSIMPIPISSSTREEIEQNLNNLTMLPVLFKNATLQIHSYIEKVQFPKFQKSESIEEVVNILSQEAGNVGKSLTRRRSSIAMQSSEALSAMNLKNILQYQSSTRFFKDFCVRIYVNESLFFWLDAENYKNLPGSDYMKRTAHKICRKYILDNARMQINISSLVKQEILQQMSKPTRSLFKKAQDDIFKLLELDAYPKFLLSPEAQQLKQCLQNLELSPSTFSKISSFKLNIT